MNEFTETTLATGIIIAAISKQLNVEQLLKDIQFLQDNILKKNPDKRQKASAMVEGVTEIIESLNLARNP